MNVVIIPFFRELTEWSVVLSAHWRFVFDTDYSRSTSKAH